MENAQPSQLQNRPQQAVKAGFEVVVPNPKLRLMDQVREVLRLKHYAIRTEQCYCRPVQLQAGGDRFRVVRHGEQVVPRGFPVVAPGGNCQNDWLPGKCRIERARGPG